METTSKRESTEAGRVDVACIILARGGSKGVPRKNLQMVGGISLLARCIRTCQGVRVRSPASGGNLEILPKIFVSTDCPQIAAEALSCRADVIDRPRSLATDEANGTDALKHAVHEIGEDYGTIALVQCTTPFLTSVDVIRCIHALETRAYDITCSTIPFHGLVFTRSGKSLTYNAGEHPNRQRREEYRMHTGGCWAFRREYLTEHPWMGGLIGMVPAQFQHYLEIDTSEDLEVARLVISGQQSLSSDRSRGSLCEVSGSNDGDLQCRPETLTSP